MIEFKNVSYTIDNTNIIKDISFTLKDNEFVGLLGPNGGGKSTFLKLALGLVKPTTGEVIRNERKISYIAQTTSISDSSFPATVKEVVSLGLVDNKPFFLNKEKKKLIDDMLEKMNLTPYKNRLVNELSGGQLQRVKIAKALISNPSLLVLDEPDAGMDEESHHHLIEILNELHEKGMSILFVSHHPEDLNKANNIYFIEHGQILTYEEELNRGHHHANL